MIKLRKINTHSKEYPVQFNCLNILTSTHFCFQRKVELVNCNLIDAWGSIRSGGWVRIPIELQQKLSIKPQDCENTIHQSQNVKNDCQRFCYALSCYVNIGTLVASDVDVSILMEPQVHAQLMNHLCEPAYICNAIYVVIYSKDSSTAERKNFSWHKLSWQSMLLHKHTPQPSCRSHRCLSWSRCGGICPCRTPPRWWQTWQWRRKAAGRFEAEVPWLSLWTSTPPGDLRERERWGRVDSSEVWQQYNKQQLQHQKSKIKIFHDRENINISKQRTIRERTVCSRIPPIVFIIIIIISSYAVIITYWGFLRRVSGVSALSPLAVFAGQSPNPLWPEFCIYTDKHPISMVAQYFTVTILSIT